jgi:hypothetical protein
LGIPRKGPGRGRVRVIAPLANLPGQREQHIVRKRCSEVDPNSLENARPMQDRSISDRDPAGDRCLENRELQAAAGNGIFALGDRWPETCLRDETYAQRRKSRPHRSRKTGRNRPSRR